MTIRAKLISLGTTLLFSASAGADAIYDRESNLVKLSTPTFSKASDHGTFKIYNEEHIELRIAGYDGKEMHYLCKKDSSLGMIVLDGKLNLDATIPSPTGFVEFEYEEDKEIAEQGYVLGFVYKGNNALDLLDFLYEYDDFSFMTTNAGCGEDSKHAGTITGIFKTKGLERATRKIEVSLVDSFLLKLGF